MSTGPKEVLILGGGFAGVYTARYLEKLLSAGEASITLVNQENYWVYQPMLPEVISGSVGLTNVVSPIRRLCPRSNLIMREVENIDLDKQIVTISLGFRPRQLRLHYDHLVIALGNITDFHGMPGLMENAMPFRTLADAMVLRNHLIHVLEEADVEENPELRRQLLTFVVGGGGFSGVEVMAELNDFVRSVKRNYLRLRNEPHRCVIVQASDRILPEMSETLADFARRILRQHGVEIILNDRLKAPLLKNEWVPLKIGPLLFIDRNGEQRCWELCPCQGRSRGRRGPKASLYKGIAPGDNCHQRSVGRPLAPPQPLAIGPNRLPRRGKFTH